MAGQIDYSHIVATEASEWHYDIPDGYFDNIGELIEEYQNHDLVKEAFHILETGDLQDYSAKTQVEIHKLEQASLAEYLDEGRTGQVLELRTDIAVCLEQISKMSGDMGAFEKDLGAVSKQIQSMLDESKEIQTTLNERLEVEVELDVLTSNVVIDDELIAGIYRAPMNETFLHYAKQLAKKRAFIQGARARSEALYDGDPSALKALEDLEPELAKLIDKMVGRIRHYLLHKILALQQPSSNVQILQQNMIKHQPLYSVLVDFNLDIASEVKTIYAQTVLNLFYGQFKLYVANLTKCASELASKNETIGQLESGRSRVTPGLFAIGDRGSWILDSIDNPGASIIPHVATSAKKTFHFERIFLSLQSVLLDTVSGELTFQKEFFNSDMFGLVFNSIISWYEDTVESYLNNCHDAIGALLMVIIIERDVKTMNERGIPHLDPYLAKQKQRIVSRLQTIFDNHIDSVISINVEDLGKMDTRPHYLARRYSEFSAAVHTLVQKLDNDAHRKIINSKIKSLHMNFQSLLTHMADTVAGSDENLPTDETKRRIFLINNYDIVLEVLNSHGLSNVLEAQEFQMHFDGEIIHSVDQQLQTHFSFLLVFIKRRPEDPIDTKSVSNFATAFNSHWKAIIKRISKDMMLSFPNLKTGVVIMKNVFSQLLTYYKRFEEILKTYHKDYYHQIQVELVPHASLTYEFGLYTSDFA